MTLCYSKFLQFNCLLVKYYPPEYYQEFGHPIAHVSIKPSSLQHLIQTRICGSAEKEYASSYSTRTIVLVFGATAAKNFAFSDGIWWQNCPCFPYWLFNVDIP